MKLTIAGLLDKSFIFLLIIFFVMVMIIIVLIRWLIHLLVYYLHDKHVEN